MERIFNRPLQVRWGGWRTDTLQLQREGWELAVEQDIQQMAMRMSMRHRDFRMYGVSNLFDFDYFRYAEPSASLAGVYIEIIHMVSNLTTQIAEQGESMFARMHAIDAVPQFVNMERKSIEDFGFFSTPLVRTQELIVDPARIGEILAQIQAAQLPEQAAIRARESLRDKREGMAFDARPKQTFHAQILSIAA